MTEEEGNETVFIVSTLFLVFVLVSDCKSVSLLSLSLTSENSCLVLKSDLFNKTFM